MSFWGLVGVVWIFFWCFFQRQKVVFPVSEVFCPVWRVGVNLSFFSSSNFLFSSVYPFINPTLTLHCWVATLRIWAKSICQEANRYRTCSAPPKPQEVMRNLRSLGFKLLFVYTIHKYSVDYVYIYILY